MSLRIGGMGWVTPLGSGAWQEVWERLLGGDEAAAETISSPLRTAPVAVFPRPAEAIANTPDAPASPSFQRDFALRRRRWTGRAGRRDR